MVVLFESWIVAEKIGSPARRSRVESPYTAHDLTAYAVEGPGWGLPLLAPIVLHTGAHLAVGSSMHRWISNLALDDVGPGTGGIRTVRQGVGPPVGGILRARQFYLKRPMSNVYHVAWGCGSLWRWLGHQGGQFMEPRCSGVGPSQQTRTNRQIAETTETNIIDT